MRKYFITKDFLGSPTDIISGDYVDGILDMSSNFDAPKRLSEKYPGFSTLEEIRDYIMCKCGKTGCPVNKELSRLVKTKLNENNS